MTERPSWAGHQLPLPALRVTHRHNEVAHRSTPHATLHAFLCHVVPSAWNVLLVNKPQFKNPFLQEPSPDFLPPLLLHCRRGDPPSVFAQYTGLLSSYLSHPLTCLLYSITRGAADSSRKLPSPSLSACCPRNGLEIFFIMCNFY